MKKKNAEEIQVGEYKINKKSKRLQGKRIKTNKQKANPLAAMFSLMLVLAMLFVSFFSIGNLSAFITYHRFIEVNAMEGERARPYKAMVVIDSESGRTLEKYNENEKLPMASTTKIMTALVAIESTQDFKKEHKIPDKSIGIEGTSIYLKAGEMLSVEDLLYGLMLASGNDAATALAIITAGSEEAFVKKMNEKATSLGLSQTNFKNPHGLHDEEHYTTAKELALITKEAMKNEMFRKIVGTKSISIKGYSEDKPRMLTTKQKLLRENTLEKEGIVVTGVKSGFTPEAGRCLVTSGIKNGMELITVLLNAPKMFESTAELLTNAFNNYKKIEVLSPKAHLTEIEVVGSDTKKVHIYHESGFSYPLTKKEEKEIEILYNYPELIVAPLKKGQEVGEVIVILKGEKIFSSPLCAIEEAEEKTIFSVIKNIIERYLQNN